MRPQTGFADVNGTRLYYEVAGSGAPLVLMHGFSLDTRMWEPQWEPFLQRHQVLRYDLRGFGRSAPPRGAPYLHHEDLKALLDRLGIVSPALLGHSTGGSVALDFAVSYPDATRALVLFGSIAGGFAFSPEFASALGAIFASAHEQGVGTAKEAWLRLLAFQRRGGGAGEDVLRRMVAGYSGWHWLNEDPVLALDPPALQRLHTIRASVLTLLGERDVPDCHRIAALVSEALPGAEHVVLPGLGHMANLEDPPRFDEAVLAFLAGAVTE
ncbi:MAG TPA: alpha/beta hydrolase [Longimicrobium sp.]|jgi:pimeloyl-ACP methyl ester carboxylesterase|uniref:alpha/beta fold hydrolase n=1 Tax=Longimicrobium sp. TaxID=2029185 RepID=UPI002EDA6340